MKDDKRTGSSRLWACRSDNLLAHRNRLIQAGYPKFAFRLVAARRALAGAVIPMTNRRHD